jgi:hypothetical protein
MAGQRILRHAAKMATNSFDARCGVLLSRDAVATCNKAREQGSQAEGSSPCSLLAALPSIDHKVLERRKSTNRFGLVRVLCFLFTGRGRMLRQTRSLADGACVPTISLFDPPTDVMSSLREVLSSLGETRSRDERTSTAAAPEGTGQDVC